MKGVVGVISLYQCAILACNIIQAFGCSCIYNLILGNYSHKLLYSEIMLLCQGYDKETRDKRTWVSNRQKITTNVVIYTGWDSGPQIDSFL